MKLNERELATVLAALRDVSDTIITRDRNWLKNAFPELFVGVEPLTIEEIDALAERLNYESNE